MTGSCRADSSALGSAAVGGGAVVASASRAHPRLRGRLATIPLRALAALAAFGVGQVAGRRFERHRRFGTGYWRAQAELAMHLHYPEKLARIQAQMPAPRTQLLHRLLGLTTHLLKPRT